MKRSRVQKFFKKRRIMEKDKEGGTYETYGPPSSFPGEAWPAGGKVQAEQYGERLSYIYNVKVIGKYILVRNTEDKQIHYVFPDTGLDLVEGDGICLMSSESDNPDYKIISIKPCKPLRLEVEKI